MSHPPIRPILASVIAGIAAAVPARGRATFLDLLLGAAATKSGHVTDAILGRHPGKRPRARLEHVLLVPRAGTLVLAAGLGRPARSADDAVPPGGLVRRDR